MRRRCQRSAWDQSCLCGVCVCACLLTRYVCTNLWAPSDGWHVVCVCGVCVSVCVCVCMCVVCVCAHVVCVCVTASSSRSSEVCLLLTSLMDSSPPRGTPDSNRKHSFCFVGASVSTQKGIKQRAVKHVQIAAEKCAHLDPLSPGCVFTQVVTYHVFHSCVCVVCVWGMCLWCVCVGCVFVLGCLKHFRLNPLMVLSE